MQQVEEPHVSVEEVLASITREHKAIQAEWQVIHKAVQEVLAHSTALKWKKQALKNLLKARGPDLVEKKPAAMHCQRTQISEAV